MNPTSHRTVGFEEPIETVQVVQLANLLLRQADRFRVRNSRESPPDSSGLSLGPLWAFPVLG
ncbi:hypothetical protein [Streptomyces sp. NPDC093991]|uniref:hypothetical protein n=1 Tax=unclassified Streptomyces TaxID=2593676 RepID=UPI003426ED9A